MSRNDSEMIELARSYCELIEASGAGPEGWLREVADLLPRLQAAITSLDGPNSRDDVGLMPDLDARFALFSHLRALLGERDGYWLEFDRVGDGCAMTGSLADDLTDIYCELKHGLRVLAERPELAVPGWLNGYESHWGRHLVDAQRHLASLAAVGRLELP